MGTKIRSSSQLLVDKDLSVNSNKITNLAPGVNPSDAVTMQQLDEYRDKVDIFTLKGAMDCSANPNFPAANAGHVYKISVAGKIGGASGTNVGVGDFITCMEDSVAAGDWATVGAKWFVERKTSAGGVISNVTNIADNSIVRFDSTTGQYVQDSKVIIDDNGSINIPSGQAYKVNGTPLKASDVGALAISNNVNRETPTGNINGSNTAYTLVNTPIAGSEMLFKNGQLLNPGSGNDYTISGVNITLAEAPIAGDILLCTYWKA